MIPVVIVGHPKREKLANELAKKVKADAIVWDVSRIGCSRNHLQAWQWLSECYDAEWGVVLEDDAVPCNLFRRNLEHAVMNSPEPILGLYLGRGRPTERQEDISSAICSEVSYFTDSQLLYGVGYAMRCDLFHCWEDIKPQPPIDEAIAYWANNIGLSIALCRNSLVDHLCAPTLIEGRGYDDKTALWGPGCDPSGKDLPEIRKAWVMAGCNTDWTQGFRALPIDGTQHGIRRGPLQA